MRPFIDLSHLREQASRTRQKIDRNVVRAVYRHRHRPVAAGRNLGHVVMPFLVSRAQKKRLDHEWESSGKNLAKSLIWRGIASAIVFYSALRNFGSSKAAWEIMAADFFLKGGGISLFLHDEGWKKVGPEAHEQFTRHFAHMLMRAAYDGRRQSRDTDRIEHVMFSEMLELLPTKRTSTLKKYLAEPKRYLLRPFAESTTYRSIGTLITGAGALFGGTLAGVNWDAHSFALFIAEVYGSKWVGLAAFKAVCNRYFFNKREKYARDCAEAIYDANNVTEALNRMVRHLGREPRLKAAQADAAGVALQYHRELRKTDAAAADRSILEVLHEVAPLLEGRVEEIGDEPKSFFRRAARAAVNRLLRREEHAEPRYRPDNIYIFPLQGKDHWVPPLVAALNTNTLMVSYLGGEIDMNDFHDRFGEQNWRLLHSYIEARSEATGWKKPTQTLPQALRRIAYRLDQRANETCAAA